MVDTVDGWKNIKRHMDDPVQSDNLVPEIAEVVERKPWGLWATIGFSLAVVAAFVAIQTVLIIGYMVVYMLANPQADFNKFARGLECNGLCLSLVSWGSMPACWALTLLFVKLRGGWNVRDYLAIKPVSMRSMLGWLGLLLVFVAASDLLTCLLGRPIVPECMVKTFQTAYSLPLLYATLMIASPVFEETLFRGFMVPGILRSRLGAVGAILIPAAGWSLMHVQYDVYSIAHIFVGGILLGAARLKTRSLYPPLAMHALMNLIATIEAALCQ